MANVLDSNYNDWKWEDSNVPHTYEPYPEKRKKLAKAIHEIDDLMKKGQWRHWPSWSHWNHVRQPLCFCFECHFPVKLKPTVSLSGKLLKLECDLCELIHYDAKYD